MANSISVEVPFFSIIVPIYNTEEYLQKCLNSIKRQENFIEFEVLLIDDGSNDGSSEICNHYCSQDSRFKYFYKSNGGLSSARNLGIKNAKGTYLIFIDSDDYVAKCMLFRLYSSIIGNDFPDIVEYKLARVNQGNLCYESTFTQFPNASSILSCKSDSSACTKVFNRQFFLKSKVLFPLGELYEDISTVYKLYLRTSKIVSINEVLYFYVERLESITHKMTITNIEALFWAANSTLDYLKSHDLFTQYGNAVQLRFISLATHCMKELWMGDSASILAPIVIKKLHAYYPDIDNIKLLKKLNVLLLEDYVENVYLWEEKLSSAIKKKEHFNDVDISLSNITLSKKINAFIFFIFTLKSKYKRIAIYGDGTIKNMILPMLTDNVCAVYDLNVTNNTICPKRTSHPSEIDESDFEIIFISVLGREKEITEFLVNERSVPQEKIVAYTHQ